MQAFQLWLCILLGLLCMTAPASADKREGRDADSVGAHKAEADVASYLSKTNGDAVAHAEGEIHPFRVALKHNAAEAATPVALEKTEQTTKDEAGAGGGAPVAGKGTPDLMRYFERAQAQSKNAGRRKAEMKMKNGALKRAARQEAEEKHEETITPIPVTSPAVAVEESAKKIELPSHPHLLAFYLDLLASQAAEQAEAADLALVEEGQVASSTGATTPTPETPAAEATGGTTPPTATGPATPATAETPAEPSTTAPAETPAETPAEASTAGEQPATGTGGTPAEGSTGLDEVTNSIVPLSHLEQLQKDLSAVEAEHAKRQAELNAELKKQQEQTRTLLEQERQGTVGLTVTPTLINPEKHLPIDPANAELYNNAPTDPAMSIKPSVFRKSNDLISEATSEHAMFVHNMPLECDEPTCYVDQ